MREHTSAIYLLSKTLLEIALCNEPTPANITY